VDNLTAPKGLRPNGHGGLKWSNGKPCYNIPPSIYSKLLANGAADDSIGDGIAYLRLFMREGNATWYISALHKSTLDCGTVVWEAYGRFGDGTGYVFLNDICEIVSPHLERDLHWTPKPLTEIK